MIEYIKFWIASGIAKVIGFFSLVLVILFLLGCYVIYKEVKTRRYISRRYNQKIYDKMRERVINFINKRSVSYFEMSVYLIYNGNPTGDYHNPQPKEERLLLRVLSEGVDSGWLIRDSDGNYRIKELSLVKDNTSESAGEARKSA